MKHRVTCWDKKEGETVFSQIVNSKEEARDLIDCENDLAAENGESEYFYNWENDKRELRYEWEITPLEKKKDINWRGIDAVNQNNIHHLPL